MMGPEAMGVANANLHWSDEKVCRNFLCGTCPHTHFTNTVRLHRDFTFLRLPSLVSLYHLPPKEQSLEVGIKFLYS